MPTRPLGFVLTGMRLYLGSYPAKGRRGLAVSMEDVYSGQQEYTSMRTNIIIDDRLMHATLRATGLKTKRAVVELGLQTLLRLKKQAEIRSLRGKLPWQGDLDAMRAGR